MNRALVLCGLLAIIGCRTEPTAPTEARSETTARPPIVLVSMDTVRSDRIPAYGYPEGSTPFLDQLRRDGILFERAYTHVPLTLPAHASMLTGLLPTQHAVRENMGYTLDGAAHPSLPRHLRELGYRTAAGISAMVIRAGTGLDEGFDLYDDDLVSSRAVTQVSSARRSGYATLAAIDPWLAESAGDPFFLFFHLYEPHRPFEAPEPFASAHDDPYDAEIAHADDIVGRLFDRLRELGIYDDALIIVTSDHGEGLGDHGDQEHGPFLYREALQVPLLVKLPGNQRAGDTVANPVQLADFYPTVLDVLGLPPDESLAGRSMLDERLDVRPVYAETYFPRLHFGWSELTSIIDYPHQLIWGPDPELYDLETDPEQLHNLLPEDRSLARPLRDALRERETEFQMPGAVDDETRQTLAALGYVGSVPVTDGPLPDPKSRIHVLRDLSAAFTAFRERRFEDSATEFRAVLAEEPEVFDAWEYLGHALMQLQRPTEALEAFEQALRLTNGAPSAAGAAAGALAALGRHDEARPLAEMAVAGNSAAIDLVVQIALAQGDLAGAEERLDEAAAAGNAPANLLVARAELLIAKKDYPGALAATESAEAAIEPGSDPETYRGLFTARGRAHAFLGAPEAARSAFVEEIERNPNSLPAYSELAVIHALMGDAPGVSTVLRSMLERNPGPAAFVRAAETLHTLGDEANARGIMAEAARRWPDDPRVAKQPDG